MAITFGDFGRCIHWLIILIQDELDKLFPLDTSIMGMSATSPEHLNMPGFTLPYTTFPPFN